jgi:carbon monoxide dehydrogenase subunit G
VKLEHSFEVAAPVERVWKALIDVEYVAPCLPGAAVTGRDDDGSYRGTFTVKLGPTTAAYNGVLRIGEVDEVAHRATLHARGTDKRGQGGATATIINTVTEAGPATTRVQAETDFAITGRLARFGRGGMIEDISNRLLQEFSQCLAQRLAAEEAADAQGVAAAAEAGPVRDSATSTAIGADPAAGEPVGAGEPLGAGEPVTSAGEPVGAGEPVVSAEVPPAPPGPAPIPPQAPASGVPAPSAPPPGPAPAAAPVRPRPATPVAAAKPVNGLTILLSVLWKRLKARFSAIRKGR